MLCCVVLCCAVLCCAVLCCAVLCCAVLCCAVLCCAVLCCAVLCCVVLCWLLSILLFYLNLSDTSLKFNFICMLCGIMTFVCLCDRYELSVREACPHPYADDNDDVTMPCTEGQYVNRARGKNVLHVHITGLTPYSKYEFQLLVSNTAGQLESPVTTSSVTLPTGRVVRYFMDRYQHPESLKLKSTFNFQRQALPQIKCHLHIIICTGYQIAQQLEWYYTLCVLMRNGKVSRNMTATEMVCLLAF